MAKYVVEKDRTVVQSSVFLVKARNLKEAIQKVKDGKVKEHYYTEYPVHDEDATDEFRYCDSRKLTDEEWEEEGGE